MRPDGDDRRRVGQLSDPVLTERGARQRDPRDPGGPPGHRKGRRAEEAVAELLVARGYRILATNLRLGALELDVVARKGPLAVVVEVRTRGKGSYTGALESVSVTKRRSLLRATDALWRRHLAKDVGVERVRIDVAAVTFADGETRVEYVAGAIVGDP